MPTVSYKTHRKRNDLTVLGLMHMVRCGFDRIPTVRFGAVIYPTVRFGMVFRIRECYGAVRCGFQMS